MQSTFWTNSDSPAHRIDSRTDRERKLTGWRVGYEFVEVISETTGVGDVLELIIECLVERE